MDTPPCAGYRTLLWGSIAAPGGKDGLLTACLGEQGFVAELWQANGEWQAKTLHLDPEGLEDSREGSITPSGTALVALCQQGIESGDLFHYHLGTQQELVITRDLVDAYVAYDDSFLMAWAPTAIRWRQICAYVHKEELAAPGSVRLVDAKVHKVLGSWTLASLKIKH